MCVDWYCNAHTNDASPPMKRVLSSATLELIFERYCCIMFLASASPNSPVIIRESAILPFEITYWCLTLLMLMARPFYKPVFSTKVNARAMPNR